MDAIPRRRLLTLSAATAAGGAMLLRARPAHAGPPYAGPPQRPPRLPELPEPTFGEVSVHDPSVLVTKIGRASCRERVEISVVAGVLEKEREQRGRRTEE